MQFLIASILSIHVLQPLWASGWRPRRPPERRAGFRSACRPDDRCRCTWYGRFRTICSAVEQWSWSYVGRRRRAGRPVKIPPGRLDPCCVSMGARRELGRNNWQLYGLESTAPDASQRKRFHLRAHAAARQAPFQVHRGWALEILPGSKDKRRL